jgi:hypothetical protein
MQRLTKHYSLFDLEPRLKKEWHPSLNDKINPRNVTLAFQKKVWWICNEGHEWKATVKCRIRGRGCPLCSKNLVNINAHNLIDNLQQKDTPKKNRANSRKQNLIFESDASNIYLGENYRRARRFKLNATAVIEIPASEHWFYTTIRDISYEGLYFETEGFLKKGAIITVKIDQPILTTDTKSYSSKIRWCKELDFENSSISTYGIGVQFV